VAFTESERLVRASAAATRWRLRNPEAGMNYYRANIEKRRAYSRAHYQKTRVSWLAGNRRWKLANPEKVREMGRADRKAGKRLLSDRAWRKANPEKVRLYGQIWNQRNREQRRTLGANHRARSLGAAGSHTAAEWTEKVALLGGVCFYCGETGPLAREHKVPLSRGGSHDISNIVPACRSCNSRKHTKTAKEFLKIA